MNIKFALAGNPNCGKTTMFNALTGANQYVGNWPGVTVEKKEGKVKGNKEDNITVVDLPGIYSLSPYTLEEVVSRDFLLNEDPDVIIDLVDATNIERNLYLTTQLMEIDVPIVVALNMMDLVEKNGDKIDVKKEIEATLAAKKSEQMIMSLMPAGIILYLQLASPGFLDILYGNPFGICAMTVCLTVYGAAYWMGKRIVEIEV